MLLKKIKLSFKVLLNRKSKIMGQYNTKSRHVSKKAPVWMEFLIDQISLKIIFKIFFVALGRDFSCSNSVFLSKAPTARYEKIRHNFCSIVFLVASTPKLETAIFLSFVVSFIMSNICK